MMRAVRRRTLLAPVIAVALVLAGCAPQPELSTDAAVQLQQQVLAVTTASADGKLEEAAAALDDAEKELDAALAQGELSPTRYREIRQAIRLVRADLQAAMEEAAKAEAARIAEEQKARDAELQRQLEDLRAQQAAEAAARQEAAERAAAEQGSGGSSGSDDGDSGKGDDDGKGDGNGKGKGKGKDN